MRRDVVSVELKDETMQCLQFSKLATWFREMDEWIVTGRKCWLNREICCQPRFYFRPAFQTRLYIEASPQAFRFFIDGAALL